MLHRFFESHLRSILKALSWKIIATITSASVLYYQNGDLAAALKFGGAIFLIGLVIYYLHERIWNSIHWGKTHLNEAD